jgi:hypothetical protein
MQTYTKYILGESALQQDAQCDGRVETKVTSAVLSLDCCFVEAAMWGDGVWYSASPGGIRVLVLVQVLLPLCVYERVVCTRENVDHVCVQVFQSGDTEQSHASLNLVS